MVDGVCMQINCQPGSGSNYRPAAHTMGTEIAQGATNNIAYRVSRRYCIALPCRATVTQTVPVPQHVIIY